MGWGDAAADAQSGVYPDVAVARPMFNHIQQDADGLTAHGCLGLNEGG